MNNFNVAVVANQPFYEQMKALEIAHLKNFSKQQFDELAKFNPQIVFIGILDPELIKKIRNQINPINIIGLTYERKISNWLVGGVDECLVMPVSSSEITNNLVVWGRITNSLNQSQLAAIKLVENLMAKETKANQPVDKLQSAAKSIDEKPKIKQVVHQPTEQQSEVKSKAEKPTEVIYPDPEVQKMLNKSIEQPEKPTIDKQPDKQLQQSDKRPLKEAVEPPVEGHDKQLEDELLSGLDDKSVEPDTKLKSVEKSPEKESEDQTDNQIKDQAENQEPVKKPVENDNSDNHSVGNADSPEKTENNDNTEKKDDNSQSEDNSDDDDIDLNDDSAFERIMNETKTGELSLDEGEDEKIEGEDESEDDDSNSNNSDDTAANEPQKQETVDETDQNVEADDQKANSQGQATSPTAEEEKVVDKHNSEKQSVGDDDSQTVDNDQPQAPENGSSTKPANDQSDDFMSKLNSLLVGLNGDETQSKKQSADKAAAKTLANTDSVTSQPEQQPKHKVIDPNEPKHHIVTSAEQKEAMKRQALDNAQNHILTDVDIKALLKAYPDDAPKIKQIHEYIQRQQDEKRKEIVALNRLQREPIPKILAKQKAKKQDPLDQLRNLKLKSVNNSGNNVADNQPKSDSKPQGTGTKPETSAPVKEPIKTPEETKASEVQKPAAPNPVEHPQTLLHFNEDNKSQPEVQQPQPPVTQPKPPVQAQPPVQPVQQPQQPVQQQPQPQQPPVEKPRVKENVQPQAPQQPAPSQDEKDKVKILSPNADLPDLGNVQNNENQYQQLLKQQQKAAQKAASNVDKSNETIPNADLDVDPTKGNNTNVKESATLEVDHPNNKKKKKHHLGLGKLFGLRKKS